MTLPLDKAKLFMIQKQIHNVTLLDGAESLDLYSTQINDFYDTAVFMNAMDLIISIDTSVLHLAGAMGKKCYALLSSWCDARWDVHNWYDSMVTVRQKTEGDWEGVFSSLNSYLKMTNKI